MITQIKKKITQIKKSPKEIVGVDISEGQITVVETTKSTYEVEGGIKDFVIKNISPTQTDDEISDVIKAVFTQKHLFKKEVWLNIDLPEPNLNFRRLSLPVMPQQELPNAIKWNLKDKVSLDIKDARLAYEITGEFQKEDGPKNLNLMAVLIDKKSIDRFLNIFKKAGIDLAGINVTPFSISNILRLDKDLAELKEPILICRIGKEYSYICVYLKGKLDFVRQIPLAWQTFLNAMTGVLVSDKGRIELTLEDAKKILEEFGIPKETDTILDEKVTPSQIIAMSRPVVERLIGEISRSIDYYQGELKAKKIQKILLTGEGSYIKGLNEFISKGLGLDAGYLELPKDLICPAAFGAAAGSIQKSGINLLPEELKQKKQDELKKTVLRVSTAGVLALLFFSFLSISIQIASYKKQLQLVQSQRLILKDLKAMQDKINARKAIAYSIREKETPVDLVLKELSAITPGNIAFSEIQLDQKQKNLKLRGKVSIRPEAVQGVLSDFMQNLEKSSLFKEANLSNVQMEGSGAIQISAFEINCVLE